jgi:manganese efflux pump family protein
MGGDRFLTRIVLPMDIVTTVAMAFGLSMDAFAVSIAEGVVIREQRMRHAVRLALFFGGFQAVMPLIGWFAGKQLGDLVAGFGHWTAFGLLVGIGAKMIYESMKLEPAEKRTTVMGLPTLLVLSVATSIDALAVGVSLSLLQVAIMAPIIVIGCVTFVMSLAGVCVGDRFGHLFESKIEVLAGLILIGIGVKIVIEHI